MKKYGIILLTSLISAILAIAIYRLIEEPKEVIIREQLPARYTNSDIRSPRSGMIATPNIGPISSTDFTSAASVVTPAVVNIKTLQGTSSLNFLRGGKQLGAASGSGVIVSAEGFIVTNNHVVEDSDEILVTLNDKREYEAKLIGTDPSTDLAVIKIKENNLPFLPFGDSDSLQIGEWVMAVGNPFNLESTVTAGIVSAKGRSINILEGQDRIESFIQTDAAVNPGNSGGALVNTRGQLVGINTAIITQSGRYEGYSFAVPSNLVGKVIRDLQEYGMVQRGLMGVFIEEVNSERAAELGLSSVEGVFITRVTQGGGAEEAGLKRGDVIISIDNVQTKTLPEMQEQVGLYRPGNSIKVEFIRDGKRMNTNVILKNKSNNNSLVSIDDERYLRQVGFELRDLSKEEARRLGGVNGVKVVSIYKNSKIDMTQMDPGFIITSVNDRKVFNVDQLIEELKEIEGQIMLEGIYEHFPESYYYVFDTTE